MRIGKGVVVLIVSLKKEKEKTSLYNQEKIINVYVCEFIWEDPLKSGFMLF